jgi:mono/diheme cytochrome c family protein
MNVGYLPLALGAASVVFTLALSAAPGQQPAPGGAAAGDPGRGKELYGSLGCAGCHGNTGGGGSGPRVTPPVAYQQFVRWIRQPTGTMPPYPSTVVSDAQVADLHAYLGSLATGPAAASTATRAASPTPATTPATAPPGNAQNGKRLYVATGCWSCHGYAGQGGSAGPRLGPPASSYPNFVAAIRQPRSDMPPYTSKILPDQDLADIYAYVKTFPEPPPVDSIPILK